MVAAGREYPGCFKGGAHRVAAGWWSVGRRMMESPGRGRMEVSRSPQDGGSRSPQDGDSRSPQDGGLQVTAGLQVIAAGWRSL